ncbi:FUSC family protein [Methylobacterium sp. ID0610]|uniref:FUSC family protein n=1 Tax=Methylobacterium carpenticola TaxID=3344827 RepID=UPI0036CC88FB
MGWVSSLPARIGTTGVPFGLRTVLAALIALWLAMWLELDTPRWAAWTVMSLALPTRGQVGLKGLWRVAGTVLGLVAAIVAVALFAQSPILMGIFIAGWCGLNSYVGGRLPGLASYGAGLSSLTAALVVVLSATVPLSVFEIALARGVEIILGVACAYAASALAEAMQGPRPGPAFPPGPVPGHPVIVANAIRAFLVVGAGWALWVATAWPSGGIFVTFAGVTAVIFSTMPDADRRARAYLGGVVIGQVIGLIVRYSLLTAPSAFGLLAVVLFPFLFIGAVGMTDPRTTGPALGYNLAFLTAVDPLNPMQYDLAASLNEAAAILGGIAFGTAAYDLVLPDRVWRLAR